MRHVKHTPYDEMTPEEFAALTDAEIEEIEERLMGEELHALLNDPDNTARPAEEFWRELGLM
jgi:hypothetical protein